MITRQTRLYSRRKRKLPTIGVRTAGGYGLAALATFTMVDEFHSPAILVHLDHQSRQLKMEVFNASQAKPGTPL